jgi:hypothetical protein
MCIHQPRAVPAKKVAGDASDALGWHLFCTYYILIYPSLVECLNRLPSSSTDARGSLDDIRIEAAHVISSISFGE